MTVWLYINMLLPSAHNGGENRENMTEFFFLQISSPSLPCCGQNIRHHVCQVLRYFGKLYVQIRASYELAQFGIVRIVGVFNACQTEPRF